MPRLDSFKNTGLENKDVVLTALIESGFIIEQDDKAINLALKEALAKQEEKYPPLRHQMIRWYNANPDMLDIACRNAIRILSEKIVSGDWEEFIQIYQNAENSLANQPENFSVSDITFLEEFLFQSYPALVSLAKYTRRDGFKPRHLITTSFSEKITIFELTNALVEFSNKKDSPIASYKYSDLLDVLVC